MQLADNQFTRRRGLQPKISCGGLETFFHENIMIRNNLRVLEQKGQEH